MSTKLILIRHGQTDWNSRKRYCSFTDIDINSEGKKQARKLRKRLRKEKIHKIYSSDKKRAFNFARAVFKEKEIEKVPGLEELDFGIFEGLTYQEIMKKHPSIYKKWLNNPFSVIVPDGENLWDFKKRVVKIFKEIISLNQDKTIAVVCHAGPIKIFSSSILKTRDFLKSMPHSASLSVIEYKNGKAKIQILNNTSHLYE